MKIPIMLFLTLFSYAMYGQTILDQNKQQEEDARWELMKKRDAMVRAFERDPHRYMDSLKKVKEVALHQEALNRIERYRKNTSLDTVGVLDLSYAQLERLPDFVFEATCAEKIVLDYNRISKLPWRLRKLSQLERIEWNHNTSGKSLKTTWLPTIKKVSLIGNNQEKLPSLGRLKNLEFLNFSSNQLSSFPVKALAKAEKLSEVIIKENPISLEEDSYEKLKNIEILKLNKCGIASVHPSLYTMPNLKELQLQENKISTLPEGISNLKNLSKVSFYKCELEELPSDFFNIPNLVIADLYYNQLKVIPASIKEAQKIEVLFLSHNHLYEVPEAIGELSQLEELYLHNNKLSYLPESLENLSDLKILRINNNLFQTFPTQVLQLTDLTILDLDDNLINSIPDAIGLLSNLDLFTFDDNPINFRDPSNKAFMEAVYSLQQAGTICKPMIEMSYLDELGNATGLNE